MSTHDLLDKLDGIQNRAAMGGGAGNFAGLDQTIYPENISRLPRTLGGMNNKIVIESSPHLHKRQVKKNMDRRGRFRTQPITFTEIKEVDEDQTEQNLMQSEEDNRTPISASTENLFRHVHSGIAKMPSKLKSKSEMDLKEFSRPLSFPHHHFRKTKKKVVENVKACDSEDEDEVEDTLGQLQPSLHHQLAPNAPLVNPLWRAATPTSSEFP